MIEDFVTVLGQLADDTRSVRSIDLSRLSDLARTEAARFDLAWAELSTARRLETVTIMVERAETDIQLNFHAILRLCLSDADGQIRRVAVDGLWENEKPSLIGPLATLLAHDPVPSVRAAAATSLGRFVLLGVLGEITETAARQAERALRVAWSRAQEPNEVRRRVLESLAYTADPAVGDLIETAYYDSDRLMRQSAIFAMGRSADYRWREPLLAELRSGDPAMRFEATVSAGEMGLSAAVQPLIYLMGDADGNISEAAALALGKIGGRMAKRALEQALSGADERLAQAAEEALEELTFASHGLEEELDDRDPESWRRHTVGMYDGESDDFAYEDEDDARLSRDLLLEDEDFWGSESRETPYWLDEEDEEDDDLGSTDSLPGLTGRRP